MQTNIALENKFPGDKNMNINQVPTIQIDH